MDGWLQTELTSRLKIRIPLIQAPMAGGITTPDLVSSVSETGALGSLGAAIMQPEDMRKAIRQIRDLTENPFNVNLFVLPHEQEKGHTDAFIKHVKSYEAEVGFELSTALPPPPSFEKQVAVILDEKVPVFSFTFGIPAPSIIREMQKHHIIVIGTATHLQEALALQEVGVDFIVCQGKEAGGHRGTFIGSYEDALIPTKELLLQVHGKVKIPIIAAGGIMNGKAISEMLKAGACGVQMGTAFIACPESGAPNAYKKALLEWKSRKTILTKAWSGKWARAIENRFLREMESYKQEIPPYPITQGLTAQMRKAAASHGNAEFLSLWAGENFKEARAMSVSATIRTLSSELHS